MNFHPAVLSTRGSLRKQPSNSENFAAVAGARHGRNIQSIAEPNREGAISGGARQNAV